MGDPGKSRSKYKGPGHPWEGWRITAENVIKREYGLKNKTEIYKANSELRRLNAQAKKLIRERGKHSAQATIEEKQLLDRLSKLNLLHEGAKLEDVLSLEIKDLLDRRLQTIVFKSGLTLTPTQARQFIVHGHISVKGKKITIPSYLVSRDEQFEISFLQKSSLNEETHPERAKKEQIKQKAAAAEKKKTKEAEEEAKPLGLTEAELEKLEKVVGVVEE